MTQIWVKLKLWTWPDKSYLCSCGSSISRWGGRRPVGGTNLWCGHFWWKCMQKQRIRFPWGEGAPAVPPWIRHCFAWSKFNGHVSRNTAAQWPFFVHCGLFYRSLWSWTSSFILRCQLLPRVCCPALFYFNDFLKTPRVSYLWISSFSKRQHSKAIKRRNMGKYGHCDPKEKAIITTFFTDVGRFQFMICILSGWVGSARRWNLEGYLLELLNWWY